MMRFIPASAKTAMGLIAGLVMVSILSASEAVAAPKTTADCLAHAMRCNALIDMTLLFSSSICMPNDPRAKRRAAVITWLMAHPERAQDEPVTAINSAAHKLWPCKNKQQDVPEKRP